MVAGEEGSEVKEDGEDGLARSLDAGREDGYLLTRGSLESDPEGGMWGDYSTEETGASEELDMSLDQIAEVLHGPGATYTIPIANLPQGSGYLEDGYGRYYDDEEEPHMPPMLTERPSRRRGEWEGQGSNEKGRLTARGEGSSSDWHRPIVGSEVRPAAGQRVIVKEGEPTAAAGLGTVVGVLADGGICQVRWDSERCNLREPMQFATGRGGIYALELCTPQDLMVGRRYVPSKNPVLFPAGRHSLSPTTHRRLHASHGEDANKASAGEFGSFSSMHGHGISRARSGVSSRRRGSTGVDARSAKCEAHRTDKEREVLHNFFLRFAEGMTRKRFHGYDPRSLRKQKIESMDFHELLSVLEVLNEAVEWPFYPDVITNHDIKIQYERYAKLSDKDANGELDFDHFCRCLESVSLFIGFHFREVVQLLRMYGEGSPTSSPRDFTRAGMINGVPFAQYCAAADDVEQPIEVPPLPMRADAALRTLCSARGAAPDASDEAHAAVLGVSYAALRAGQDQGREEWG